MGCERLRWRFRLAQITWSVSVWAKRLWWSPGKPGTGRREGLLWEPEGSTLALTQFKYSGSLSLNVRSWETVISFWLWRNRWNLSVSHERKRPPVWFHPRLPRSSTEAEGRWVSLHWLRRAWIPDVNTAVCGVGISTASWKTSLSH